MLIGILRRVVAERAIAVWSVSIFAETLHGGAREVLLEPYVGDLRARRIGVFSGAIIFFCIALASVRWVGARRTSRLLGVGVLWLSF